MSETSDSLSECPWCVELLKKEHVAVHFMKHLEYKKFDCGDCSSAFYTEAEREHHCRKKSHMHAFTVRLHAWKEMVLTSFVRDTKLLEVCEESTVLKHRLRLMDELDDFLLNNAGKKDGITGERTVRTPVQESSRSNRLTRSSTPTSRRLSMADSISTERSKGASGLSEVSLSVVRQSPEMEHRSRKRTETDSSIDIDSVRTENRDGVDLLSPPASTSTSRLSNSNSLSSSTIIRGAALNMSTEILELKCRICKKMVQNDYLIRKDHVTTNHLTANHGPNDYLRIVESKMQSCFPGWTSNDLQCQLSGCGGKTYLSKSGRRGHVLRVHFQDELKCPMARCIFGATDPVRVHQHAKEDHKLNDGYRSMRDQTARQKFEFEKRSHNYKLEQLIQKAFPSAIPDPEYLKGYSPKVVGAETVSSLIETLRKTERISQPNTVAPPPLRASSFSDSDSSDSDEEVAKSKKAEELKKKEEEERRRKREKEEEEERQRELKRKEKKREEKEERQKEERELERKRLMKEARRLEKAKRRAETEQEDRDRAEGEKKAPGKLELRRPRLDADEEKEDIKPQPSDHLSIPSLGSTHASVCTPQPSDHLSIPSLGSTHASVCTVSSVKEEVDDIDDEVQIIEGDIKRRVKREPISVQKTELCTPPPRKRTLLEAPGGSHSNPQVPVKRDLLTTPAGARLVSTDNTTNRNHVAVERDLACHSLSTSIASTVSIPSQTVFERFVEQCTMDREKNAELSDRAKPVKKTKFNDACKKIQEGQFTFAAWRRVVSTRKALAIIRGQEEGPIQMSVDQRNNLRTLYDGFVADNIANGKKKNSQRLTDTQMRECLTALHNAAKMALEAQSSSSVNHFPLERDLPCLAASSAPNVSIPSTTRLDKFSQDHLREQEENEKRNHNKRLARITIRFKEASDKIQKGQCTSTAWRRLVGKKRAKAIIKGEQGYSIKFSQDQIRNQENNEKRKHKEKLARITTRFKEASDKIQNGQFTLTAWKRFFCKKRAVAIIKGEQECPIKLSATQRSNLRELYDDMVAMNVANGKESGWLFASQELVCESALRRAAKDAWESR